MRFIFGLVAFSLSLPVLIIVCFSTPETLVRSVLLSSLCTLLLSGLGGFYVPWRFGEIHQK